MRSALAWMFFPLVPAFLGRAYYSGLHRVFFATMAPDPWDWSWDSWLLMVGPLFGFGFLAGATLGLPDDTESRGPRAWISRRSFYVGVGPWIGFLIGAGLFLAFLAVSSLTTWLIPQARNINLFSGLSGLGTGLNTILLWTTAGMAVAILGYGWLYFAVAVIRRAKRLGHARRAIERGLAMALAFLGSLLGGFWAVTTVWKSYFFDPRIMPLVLAASGLLLAGGCSEQVSYGDMRRRDLFTAMLTAWILGLAVMWRWWSRRTR